MYENLLVLKKIKKYKTLGIINTTANFSNSVNQSFTVIYPEMKYVRYPVATKRAAKPKYSKKNGITDCLNPCLKSIQGSYQLLVIILETAVANRIPIIPHFIPNNIDSPMFKRAVASVIY